MQAIGGLKSILDRFTRVVAAGLVLLLLSAPASAVVIAVADPEDGFGESPDILTVDVYDETLDPPANYAQRGVAFDRRLRQTFQNPAAFNVGQITIAFNGEGGGVPGGFALRFYRGRKRARGGRGRVLASQSDSGSSLRWGCAGHGELPSVPTHRQLCLSAPRTRHCV